MLLVQESCVAPRLPWKNRTAGFHRIDASVPTEVLGWLERERASEKKKRKEKDSWSVGTVSKLSPLFFPVFHGIAQLPKSKVQRASVESD